jgi:hypothetical protein
VLLLVGGESGQRSGLEGDGVKMPGAEQLLKIEPEQELRFKGEEGRGAL